jgi:hypothetical protein
VQVPLSQVFPCAVHDTQLLPVPQDESVLVQTHLLPEQVLPVPHALPQVAQLLGSEVKSAHPVLHGE